MRITRIACVLVFVLAGAIAPVHGQEVPDSAPMAGNLCYTLTSFALATPMPNNAGWVYPENPNAVIRLWSGAPTTNVVSQAELFGLALPQPYSSRTGTYHVYAVGTHAVDNPLVSDPERIATMSRVGNQSTGHQIGDSFTLVSPREWSRHSPDDNPAEKITRWRSNKTMYLRFSPRDINSNNGREYWTVPACSSVMVTVQIRS